jgi:hypothetical protein
MFLCDLENDGNKFSWMFAEVWTFELKAVSHYYIGLSYIFIKNY